MLFNSYVFIFGFLPIALAGYQLAGRYSREAVIAWLSIASLVFYAYWRPPLVILLVASITVNYCAAALISRKIPNSINTRVWLWAAIIIDLGTLCYFKYLFPFFNFLTLSAGSSKHWPDVILPLGISFFTFTQIAFLVDLQQGAATLQNFSNYVLFVTFFPHLIAGPIIHHKEIMPQFQQDRPYRLRWDDLAVGFSWFIMGLGKKVLIADYFARDVDEIFLQHSHLAMSTAWYGVLSYVLQLYFDFSGYSDMALGLARMFSVDFPLNFSSPYKAANIIDFWQRWHMTLTRYITVYVYNPLQHWIISRRVRLGKKISRKALATPEGFVAMLAFPMLFTMFIAGVWHGAGLQFIVFGLLHGCYLTVNHMWHVFKRGSAQQPAAASLPGHTSRLKHASSVLLTFACVVIAQVFFRADSCRHALSILCSMTGGYIRSSHLLAPGETVHSLLPRFAAVVLGFAIVWALPNTQQILGRFKPSLEVTSWDRQPVPRRLIWAPTASWMLILAGAFFWSCVHLQDPSTFLYFQF